VGAPGGKKGGNDNTPEKDTNPPNVKRGAFQGEEKETMPVIQPKKRGLGGGKN